MDYFTYQWAAGDLDDDASEDVIERYDQFLASLDQSGPVWHFATRISLNDAYVDRVVFDQEAKRLELFLLTGDLQVGYWHTCLSYTGARLVGEGALRTALARRPSEIWYDEFSNGSEGMSHGFLLAPISDDLAPAGEFRVCFDTFDFSQNRADRRELLTAEDQSDWSERRSV